MLYGKLFSLLWASNWGKIEAKNDKLLLEGCWITFVSQIILKFLKVQAEIFLKQKKVK